MKIAPLRVISIIFLACLFIGCAKNSDVAALKSEIADQKREINSLHNSISSLADHINDQNSRIEELGNKSSQKSDEGYTKSEIELRFEHFDSELDSKVESPKFNDLEARVDDLERHIRADSNDVLSLEIQINDL